MHPEAKNFLELMKGVFPEYFAPPQNVLDMGSLDINGCNRYLFPGCRYVGVDVGPGRNVDVVSLAHKFDSDHCWDTIVSTEMMEHDKHLQLSLANMVRLLRKGGLMILTCATTGRKEHGTTRRSKRCAPLVPWEHYENVTQDMIEHHFKDFDTAVFDTLGTDLRFYGIK